MLSPADREEIRIMICQELARELAKATGFWLTTAEAAVYTKRPSMKAFRHWAYRKGIVMVDGRVSRRDIDAAMKGRGRS